MTHRQPRLYGILRRQSENENVPRIIPFYVGWHFMKVFSKIIVSWKLEQIRQNKNTLTILENKQFKSGECKN